jgi:hypothetical protein
VDLYLPTMASKTHRTREQTLGAFMKHDDKIKVSALTKRYVRSFLKPDWAPSTRHGHIMTIVAYLNMAVRLALDEGAPFLSEREQADTIEAWSEP